MPVFIQSNVEETITIEEYLHHIENEVDLTSDNDILNSASKLKALANNKSLISDIITQYIDKDDGFDVSNPYAEQSIMLGAGPGFAVRANIWHPPEYDTSLEMEHYAYELCHDHNFSLLTVGYYGPGYTTDLFTYNKNSVQGYAGEKVDLKSHGRFQLTEGSLLFLKSSYDLHTQIPPKDISISINLLIPAENMGQTPQYMFDANNKKIVDVTDTTHQSNNSIISLMDAIHAPSSDKWWDYALGAKSEHFRLKIYEKLIASSPESISKIRTLEKSKYILNQLPI